MARTQLPINTDEPLGSDIPGVEPPDLQERVSKPLLGGYVQYRNLQPMPYTDGGLFAGWNGRQWGNGWVSGLLMDQLMTDSKIAQATTLFCNATIARQMRSVPRYTPSDPRHIEAWRAADRCTYYRDRINGDYTLKLRSFLRGIRGHQIAAIQTRVEDSGPYKGKWTIDHLDMWPSGYHCGYRFMQDEYGRFAGVEVDEATGPRVIDKRKFAIFSFRSVDDNPYGTNIYAPACEPYYKSVQADPEALALLTQYGRPGLYIIAPKTEAGMPVDEIKVFNADNTPVLGLDGQPVTLTPLQYNAIVTRQYKAGSVVNLAGGSMIGLLQATPGGESLFRWMKDETNRDKIAAILGTDSLTENNRTVSAGNADSGEQIVNYALRDARRSLEAMDEALMYVMLEVNYGPAYAKEYAPYSDIGSATNARMTAQMNATSALINNGAYDEDQWFITCWETGQPLPRPGAKRVVDPSAAKGAGGNQNG